MQYQSLHLDPRQPIFGHGKSRPTIAQKGALRLISNKRALKPSIQWRATTLRFLCQSSTVTDGSPRQNLRRQEYWTMLNATDPAWLIKTLLGSKTRYKLGNPRRRFELSVIHRRCLHDYVRFVEAGVPSKSSMVTNIRDIGSIASYPQNALTISKTPDLFPSKTNALVAGQVRFLEGPSRCVASPGSSDDWTSPTTPRWSG